MHRVTHLSPLLSAFTFTFTSIWLAITALSASCTTYKSIAIRADGVALITYERNYWFYWESGVLACAPEQQGPPSLRCAEALSNASPMYLQRATHLPGAATLEPGAGARTDSTPGAAAPPGTVRLVTSDGEYDVVPSSLVGSHVRLEMKDGTVYGATIREADDEGRIVFEQRGQRVAVRPEDVAIIRPD